MTPEEHLKTCCIVKCINSQPNSKVNFFSFPEVGCRSDQRNRWVHAIKYKNGRSWMPTVQSLVCSKHFVKGQPSTDPQDTDFVPSLQPDNKITNNQRNRESMKSCTVSVKKFGLEYIKHDALLKKPSRANGSNERKCAYMKLAAALGVSVKTVRALERRFREYFEEKMADPPDNKKPPDEAVDGKPDWLSMVAKRIINRLPAQAARAPVSPGGVVAALCAAARARGSLCSTGLYNDVRRELRLSSPINDLHAVWVSAQRVSLQQVVVAGRAGDAAHAAPPPAAAAVADLVLLHTDVDIVTDESVTLYEESAALHTLWQLIQRHRLEDAAPANSRVRAQRWTRAHKSYLDSGRTVSLVVLQRRWYELKLQARVRLAMHWRRPPGPQLCEDLIPAPDPAPDSAPDPTSDSAPDPTSDSAPHELHPRPAPLHIAILKRYPHIATGEFRTWRQQVLEGTIVTEPLEDENDVKETQSNNNDQSTTDTGDDAAVKQLYPNMSKVGQSTVDVANNEQTFYNVPLIEQSTAYDQSAEHATENDPLAEKPKTAVSDLLAVQYKVDDLLINQSTVLTKTESHVAPPGNAATADIPDMLDAQDGPDKSSEQIHHAEDKSNEVMPPKFAYSSDIDTDTEDNLVIDECSNKTTCSLILEPVPHTETHSFNTVLPNAAVRNIAPTIEVLHLIDPNTVKTEIVFESDEDDIEPCNEVDKDEIELDATKEVPFISNRLMFFDEEPGSFDVKSENDVTFPMKREDGQKMDDPVNDTSNIDHKLLMDTQVQLFRIDEIRAWRKNVRKDNSIRVSRIHRRYYTPKPKNGCKNTKTRTQNTRLNVGLRTSARLTSTATTTETPEIKVDKSCLDKVSNTNSIRQLCKNIKRELIDEEQLELLEGKVPNKKPKIELDSDDDEKPLLVLREGKPPRESTDETKEKVVSEMVEESSSDDELLNDEMFNKLRGEERKRGRGSYYAASTIEWSSAFAPALGRVAKRVSLPDIESVRRYNSGMQVAQVAPIPSAVGENGDDAMQVGQDPGAVASEDTAEATAAAPAQLAEPGSSDGAIVAGQPPCHENRDMPYDLLPPSRAKPLESYELDLPADDELQAALEELTSPPAAEAALERSHCCAARRHREVNDSRRRIGLVEIPLHNHPDGVCSCCCTHLSDADARQHLDQQLRALHQDIEQMLRKATGGKIQAKPAQKHSRSPSPARASTLATSVTATTSAHKQATKDAPSNTATVAKGSKAKPATNRSKRRRTRARAPTPPAPLANDFEEWQRQKNMNAKYFHINSNVSTKKDKSAIAQGTAMQSTSAQGSNVESTTAQGRAVQRASVKRTAVQSTIAQGRAVQSTTAKRTAVQRATAQDTAVQSTTAKGRSVQSTSAQGTAVDSTISKSTAVQSTTVTTQSSTVQSATPPQNIIQPGLMPYIRQSRLVSPPEEPPRSGRFIPVVPLRRRSPVAIAPKPADMPKSELALHNTVVDEPANTTEGAKNLTIPNYHPSQAAGPRRMNLTAEQVSEPTQAVQVMTGPIDKPVSILEEYSRTLSIEPVNNIPVVNALSLRVPSGGLGPPKTTIVMALTLPSDDVIKQTINRLYANDTVDLTDEPETSNTVIAKTFSKQKTTGAVDLVAAVKSVIYPGNNKNSGRSLLKPVKATDSDRSLLTAALDKPTSLSKKLHDADVIEIDDTDSDHSNNSGGNQSSNSNMSSVIINKSSNPAVYVNKVSNQAYSSSTKESSDLTTIKTDVGSANSSTEFVSKTNECSSQASTTNSTNQAVDKGESSREPSKAKKGSKERTVKRGANPVFKRSNVSVEAVSSHSVARPCSRIPVLTSLTDGSRRCPARFANVAAMTDFMATLRRAAAQADKEVYCHKWSAVEQPVSALPCGGTLLCVDGAQPPLVLPALVRHNQRATPHSRAHLVLTDADPPCALPTYWTLSSFSQMARVVPDELLRTSAPTAPTAHDPEPGRGGARWCGQRGQWVTSKEDRKICDKNHNFKILTAFCSADGIRQAARAGASLLLLSVQRARVVVLTLQRHELRGVVRYRAIADVEKELLWELEVLLNEAEIDEQLGGRADIIGQ